MPRLHELSDASELKALRTFAKGSHKLASQMSSFSRKKAELFERLAQDLKTLIESHKQKVEFLKTDYKLIEEQSTLFALWKSLTSSTFEEASVFDDLGKVMRARVKAHDDNFASLRKTTKVVLQDISESGAGIHRLEGVCEKARAANDACCKQYAAASSPKGMMKKMSDTAFIGKFFTKMNQDRAETTQGMTRRSHNDYVLQLTAANVQRRKYFDVDLPEMLDTAQDLHAAVNKEVADMSYHLSLQFEKSMKQAAGAQVAVVEASKKVSPDFEVALWMAHLGELKCVGQEDIDFVAPVVDGNIEKMPPNKLMVDGDEKLELGRHMFLLDEQVTKLAQEFKTKSKEVMACEKMLNVYKKQPQFGSSKDAFRQLYAVKRSCRVIQTLMQRNQNILSLLQRMQLTPVAPDTEEASAAATKQTFESSYGNVDATKQQSAGTGFASFLSWGKNLVQVKKNDRSVSMVFGDDDEWDDDDDDYYDDNMADTAATKVYAVALYDYKPQNSDELELVAGCRVQVTTQVGEWWTGFVEDRAGMFPANYVTLCSDSGEYGHQAMFDYDATCDEELTIKAGDLLALVESNDDGWSIAMRASDGAQGLVPTEYLDEVQTGLENNNSEQALIFTTGASANTDPEERSTTTNTGAGEGIASRISSLTKEKEDDAPKKEPGKINMAAFEAKNTQQTSKPKTDERERERDESPPASGTITPQKKPSPPPPSRDAKPPLVPTSPPYRKVPTMTDSPPDTGEATKPTINTPAKNLTPQKPEDIKPPSPPLTSKSPEATTAVASEPSPTATSPTSLTPRPPASGLPNPRRKKGSMKKLPDPRRASGGTPSPRTSPESDGENKAKTPSPPNSAVRKLPQPSRTRSNSSGSNSPPTGSVTTPGRVTATPERKLPLPRAALPKSTPSPAPRTRSNSPKQNGSGSDSAGEISGGERKLPTPRRRSPSVRSTKNKDLVPLGSEGGKLIASLLDDTSSNSDDNNGKESGNTDVGKVTML
eukprot:m.90916 g.90916  ORF g.90916 m.90916 type:complete len:993 (+) comp13281_c0_seq2:235-3213(+)